MRCRATVHRCALNISISIDAYIHTLHYGNTTDNRGKERKELVTSAFHLLWKDMKVVAHCFVVHAKFYSHYLRFSNLAHTASFREPLYSPSNLQINLSWKSSSQWALRCESESSPFISGDCASRQALIHSFSRLTLAGTKLMHSKLHSCNMYYHYIWGIYYYLNVHKHYILSICLSVYLTMSIFLLNYDIAEYNTMSINLSSYFLQGQRWVSILSSFSHHN